MSAVRRLVVASTFALAACGSTVPEQQGTSGSGSSGSSSGTPSSSSAASTAAGGGSSSSGTSLSSATGSSSSGGPTTSFPGGSSSSGGPTLTSTTGSSSGNGMTTGSSGGSCVALFGNFCTGAGGGCNNLAEQKCVNGQVVQAACGGVGGTCGPSCTVEMVCPDGCSQDGYGCNPAPDAGAATPCAGQECGSCTVAGMGFSGCVTYLGDVLTIQSAESACSGDQGQYASSACSPGNLGSCNVGFGTAGAYEVSYSGDAGSAGAQASCAAAGGQFIANTPTTCIFSGCGSCDLVTAGFEACTSYLGGNFTLQSVQSACAGAGGSYAASACPPESGADCAVGFGTGNAYEIYYTGGDAGPTPFEQYCDDAGGDYFPGI